MWLLVKKVRPREHLTLLATIRNEFRRAKIAEESYLHMMRKTIGAARAEIPRYIFLEFYGGHPATNDRPPIDGSDDVQVQLSAFLDRLRARGNTAGADPGPNSSNEMQANVPNAAYS